MKRIVTIALLSILLLQTGGLLLIYKIQQSNVQHTMFQAIKVKETGFLTLTLSVPEFQKSKLNSREISLNGKMYDIKSAKITGRVVELLVINDILEKNILEKVKGLTQNTGKNHSELPAQLVKLLMNSYISPLDRSRFMLHELQGNSYFPFFEKADSFSAEISSPPPELV